MIIKFADDLTQMECLSRGNAPSNVLQTILVWSQNNLPLNPKKRQQIIIRKAKGVSLDSYKCPDIQLVKKVPILGVTFSDDLKWKVHFKLETLSEPGPALC